MHITWYGQSCFKFEAKDAVIAVDPFEKTAGLVPPRFRADIVAITHGHPRHANSESLGGSPFIMEGPGEYEKNGIMIRGIQTFHDAVDGKERGLNTIYVFRVEGMAVCHMGDFGEKELRDELVEAVGDVDILLIPVGGTHTIDGKTAARVAHAIEPRIAIPMHYKIPGLAFPLDSVDLFLKEMGVKEKKAEEKLTMKKKDLPEEDMRVVVLAPAR